ncbi:hypothetical protein CSX00_12995 [Pseudobutyrivibrio ruminis]|uniref:DUF2974 domain-containing protein n=1 Tax=Pseudobutyrivibrio ruminis TaxID=46206 RepID=A0A2G3E6W7_9FIRM|nr:Mbeg1-like protein [Pseudobutyrivibrio ruminis]PHU38984.1 hypothetical protein CSX00_12995 [Pseudobutyrivibrio ruminis]
MTDEKLALLEHITYIDENVLKAAGIEDNLLELDQNKTIEYALKSFDDKALDSLRNYRKKTLFNIGNEEKQNIVDGALISGKDWANIIETIRSDEELKNLVVKDSEQITTKKGKKYNLQICYQEPVTKQGIITYKGTTGYEEWDDNVKAIYQKDTPRQDNALKFFQRNEKYFDDIVLVGHSKGGNKAMYTTIVSDSDKISKCIAMDGQGFSNEFFEGYVAQIEKHGSKITNYSVDRDFVHVLMKQIPNSDQKYCEAYGVLNGAQFHSPFTMFKSQDGKMELNGSDKSPVFVNTNENRHTALLRKFTIHLMDKGKPEDIEKIANYIGPLVGDLLGNGSLLKALYQAIVGNLKNLITIAKETIQFSKSENVTLKDWRGLIQTLGLKDTGKDNTESIDNQQVVNNEKTVENVIEFPTLESQDSLKSKKIITEQRDPYEKKYMFKSHKPEAETINQMISIEQPQWDVECER